MKLHCEITVFLEGKNATRLYCTIYQLFIKYLSKIAKLRANIEVGSENRKEMGGKMSIYSTKKIEGDIL
jgi:hypothetical protein